MRVCNVTMNGSSVPMSGLYINLYDEDSLNLYLTNGIYGFLMNPERGEINQYSKHHAALADYGCGRTGTHVFFFRKRRIVYGGQLIGDSRYGCFYLNGPYSPMGRNAKSEVYWDESSRYQETGEPGLFKMEIDGKLKERCQPFLIRFEDKLGLKGKAIRSDDLYFELGSYPYPLPANAIQGMSFCTLTPGETKILLKQLSSEKVENVFKESKVNIELEGTPLIFKPEYGIQKMSDAIRESHLEAAVLAYTDLLPTSLRPRDVTLCRQIPISPFKPSQMDRADICYYSHDMIREGTVPNTVIELKHCKAGKGEVEQVVRYAEWLKKVVKSDSEEISYHLLAPDYTSTAPGYIPQEFRNQIHLHTFSEDEQSVLG